MKNNFPTAFVATLSLALLGVGGCVSQDKYDALRGTNQTSAARLEQLNQENRTLQASLDLKQRRIDELEGEVGQLRHINEDLGGQIGGIRGRQQALVDELGNIRFTMLDPETDRALQALAAQYPDLIRYDASRGMIQFMSDLTFDSGSDVVKPQARESLQRLARILTGAAAANYEVRLVGHTDSQQPGRMRNRFPTNRHLSVARSIAVEEVLRSAGLNAARMETSGWGEYRPVVPNNPSGGTPANRRVEIFVVAGSASAAAPSFPVATPAGRAQPDEMPMK